MILSYSAKPAKAATYGAKIAATTMSSNPI